VIELEDENKGIDFVFEKKTEKREGKKRQEMKNTT
jgi:hypothetical protein